MAMPAAQQVQQAMHFSVLSWLNSQAASHSQDRMFVYTLPRMVLQSIWGYLSYNTLQLVVPRCIGQ